MDNNYILTKRNTHYLFPKKIREPRRRAILDNSKYIPCLWNHFGSINREETLTLLNDHFSRENHKGVNDFEIHIVDFIKADAKSAAGQTLRLKVEKRWINRLRSAFPDGLNYLE